VVVEPILGVVNVVPVPIDVPVATLYQFIEPAEACSLLVPASQRAADEVEVMLVSYNRRNSSCNHRDSVYIVSCRVARVSVNVVPEPNSAPGRTL
jgi:hypothetical protein